MAARGDDLAIGDPDAAGVGEMHEAAALGERHACAVERKPGQRQSVGVTGRDQRGTAAEDETGGAAHADDLGAGRKVQIARTIDAGP